jgi:hypothetical protein
MRDAIRRHQRSHQTQAGCQPRRTACGRALTTAPSPEAVVSACKQSRTLGCNLGGNLGAPVRI